MFFREQQNAVEALMPRFQFIMNKLGAFYPDRGEYTHLIAQHFGVMLSETPTCQQEFIEEEYKKIQIALLQKLLERTVARFVQERERVSCYEALADAYYAESEKLNLEERGGSMNPDIEGIGEYLFAMAGEFEDMRSTARENVQTLEAECVAQLAGLVEMGDTSLTPIQCLAEARNYRHPSINPDDGLHNIKERNAANAAAICFTDIDIASLRLELAEVNLAYLNLAALAGYGADSKLSAMLTGKRHATVNFAGSNSECIRRAAMATEFAEISRTEAISERYDRSRLYSQFKMI
ncbi:MAG: hypothetical protein GC136_00970 [Alphaproteobacteria bacterium]|nr:hypothetical protein [Alphaproteobacteria bacterium]